MPHAPATATCNERQTGRNGAAFDLGFLINLNFHQTHRVPKPSYFGSLILKIYYKLAVLAAMVFGFIGQELSETTSSPSTTGTTPQQQQPPQTAQSQTGGPTATYIPVEKMVSEVDAVHNTLLVGLLIALVAASVALGFLTIYCLRQRAQKKTLRDYQAELHEIQRKDDEERAAAGTA
ncbi:hypothetical protein NLG97_g2490 [Lecanicillium saksenae]|uniref:Uncharacterized protein n=1 Tax=Lecanicillium saksenae TaxID=468837 RepID=A0ACC1R2K8_9HYPO|nr:hypothetical protein NLG97_g2490 [Lecanicillium saksenae]